MTKATSPHRPAATAVFNDHAVAIAKRQYFQPGDEGVEGMFRRVANWVAQPEKAAEREAAAERFYQLMLDQRFCPGGRVLAGAATQHGNVLNCFVQDGRPEQAGTDAWTLNLATKLALVTKVGGGNGVNLDPIAPKRRFAGKTGRLYLTVSQSHPDYDKIRTGTFLDLVRGEMVTRGYRAATFVERDAVPASATVRLVADSVDDIWHAAADMAMGLLRGQDVLIDLSDLRAEGTPVKGSGGTSSGPSSFAVEIYDHFAIWAALGGAEYAGPVATLRYVFSPTLRAIRQGGSRRGAGMATLSVTHPDVQDFITAKDLEREQAEGDISTFNISVLVTDEFMAASLDSRQGVLMDIAQHAWATGEPGLIYIDRINQYNPMRAALGDIKSTNPCVTADTWVQTQTGARQVSELVGKRFCAVVDGKAFGLESNGFWSTGVKPVFKLRTRRGFELRLTGNHKLSKVTNLDRYSLETQWLELSQLSVGDRISLQDQRQSAPWAGEGTLVEGWLLGTLVGDGTFITDKAQPMAALDFWGEGLEEFVELAVDGLELIGEERPWVTRRGEAGEGRARIASKALAALAARFDIVHGGKSVTDAVERAGYDFYRGFLRGLFDADGSVQGSQAKGVSVRLAQSDSALLVRVQRMLARLGIISTLYTDRRPAGERSLPDGRGGNALYECRADHELVVSGENLAVFAHKIGFEHPAKQAKLESALAGYKRRLNRERFFDKIISIEPDGEAEVFDVTVERVHAFDANGIAAHNCGEIPLYPGEPCDLGAINLAAYVTRPGEGTAGFDFDTFAADTRTCVRFLDNVLDVNVFALEDNREMSMKLRRLGLGVMGLADALIRMGYAYNSEAGRQAVDEVISAMRDAATEASEDLANERGAFPLYDDSSLRAPRRNVAVLTVAPTGTTSMLMGVSSGVEPVFAPFIYRKIGTDYHALIHPLFQELLERHAPVAGYDKDGAWDWDKVVEKVQANHGSVQGLDFVPDDVRSVLICAHDIAAGDHVKMQGVVQRAFDGGKDVANSISKTINLVNEATAADVFDAYAEAFVSGCKGITVYRDGSRDFQVLSTSTTPKKPESEPTAQQTTESAHGGTVTTPDPVSKGANKRAQPQGHYDRLPGEPLFDRPLRLSGFTDQVKLMLPSGEKRGFFVTVNKQDGLPTEVFIVSGKAGDEANADSEALGRVVSIALQYGVPAEALVKTLRGINGGMYGSYHGRMVASKADLLAVALETAGVENVLNHQKGCPDCGAPLRFEEGCQKCESCGYSKCG